MDWGEDWRKTDKEKGQPAEHLLQKLFVNVLKKKYGTTDDDYNIFENKDITGDAYFVSLKNLDMNCNNTPKVVFVEVKNDDKGTTTGNIFIEYWSRGKKSGILASESCYWAVKFYKEDVNRDVFYFIKKERLFQACHDKRFFRDNVRGGDYNLNIGVLFTWEVFEEITKEGIEAKDGSMIIECNENKIKINII